MDTLSGGLRHDRSWDKGRLVEDTAHIEALVAHKAKASENRGMPGLFTAVPEARRLIEALAERGGNIGGAVARLGELAHFSRASLGDSRR